MAMAALLAVAIGAKALGAIAGGGARNEEAKAAMEEHRRQQVRLNEQARESRSDIARQTDREVATALATAGDGGGTPASSARLGAAIAGISGLSVGRVNSNLVEAMAASRAEQKSIRRQTKAANITSTLALIGGAASSAMAFQAGKPATKAPTVKLGAPKGNFNADPRSAF